MSSRPYLKPFPVIIDGNMSSAVESLVTSVGQLSKIGYNLEWTGNAVGEFDVQVCNDAEFDGAGAYIAGSGSWVSLPLTPAIGPAGTGDFAFADVAPTAAAFIRIVFQRDSGSGTLNAQISGKC